MSIYDEGELRSYNAAYRPVGSIWPVKGEKFAWVENGPGGGSFIIPDTSLRWSPLYVAPGNIIEFHHRRLPYVWIGRVTEQDHNDGEVTITCMSDEWLMQKRFTEDWTQAVGTAGSCVRLLFDQAIIDGPLFIVVGDLDRSGPEYYIEYSLTPIHKALGDLVENTGGSWWIEKTAHNHVAPHRLRWARQRGRDRRASVVLNGDVINKPSYKVSGTNVANGLLVIGGGTGSALWQKPHFKLFDRVAIRAMQGLVLMETVEFSEIIDLDLLLEEGRRELSRRSKALRTLGINIGPARGSWGAFWIGDIIRVMLQGKGYNGLDVSARVLSIQVEVDSGTMGLVIELLS